MQFSPPHRGSRLWINVTSLIDVMFLLLIFFLVSSTFKRHPAIKLELPRVGSSTTVSQQQAPTVYLTEGGELYLDQRQVDEQELSRLLRQRLAAGAEQRVILRIDARVEFEPAARIFALLEQAGFNQVNISVRREQ